MVGDFERDILVRAVRRHLPGDPSFEPILTGKFNTSFIVRCGKQEYVLRIAPPDDSVFLFYERRMMAQEPGLHRLLRERTDVPVAEIIAHDTSREVLDRDFLIMERLPGRAWSEMMRSNDALILRQMGTHLTKVHRITTDRYGYLGEHAPMKPCATWFEAFTTMWGKLLEDVVATGHYSPREAERLRALLMEHRYAFNREVPASLLHMDVWSQNILVDSKSIVTGIVDWDRALWGDPEIEFAVLDYCGISMPPFWEGYEAPRDGSPEAEIRQSFYLLYELQKYIVIRHGRENDPARARRYKAQTANLLRQCFPTAAVFD